MIQFFITLDYKKSPMKNNYKLLSQDDDLENNLDTSNQIELINYELINCEKVNNTNENKDYCSICLEMNNNTSIELKCKCGNKFHSNCVKNLKKHNIKICPLCKKNIYDTANYNTDNNYNDLINGIEVFIKIIFFLFVGIYFFSFMIIFIINPVKYIIFPSELKYCDNIYYKCEYYHTRAILKNNTINELYRDFNIKYQLLSSYEYFDYKTKKNTTCVNLESHEFIGLQEALKISQKSIGTEKDIFVPFNNNTNKSCKLSYKFYDSIKFILNALTLLNFIWLIPIGISFSIMKNYIEPDEYIQNINKYLKKLIIILNFLVMSIHFILQYAYVYYIFFF